MNTKVIYQKNTFCCFLSPVARAQKKQGSNTPVKGIRVRWASTAYTIKSKVEKGITVGSVDIRYREMFIGVYHRKSELFLGLFVQ